MLVSWRWLVQDYLCSYLLVELGFDVIAISRANLCIIHSRQHEDILHYSPSRDSLPLPHPERGGLEPPEHTRSLRLFC